MNVMLLPYYAVGNERDINDLRDKCSGLIFIRCSHLPCRDDIGKLEDNERQLYSEIGILYPDESSPEIHILKRFKGQLLRDLAVSYDAKSVLFSIWDAQDKSYHIAEIDIRKKRVRMITGGTGFYDIEPQYLPDGGIVFSSNRCMQAMADTGADVFNLYRVESDGSGLRRLTYDCVHNVSPTVLDDGTIIFARDYGMFTDERSSKPLYQINPDGTFRHIYFRNDFSSDTCDISDTCGLSNRNMLGVLQSDDGLQKLCILSRDNPRNSPDWNNERIYVVADSFSEISRPQRVSDELFVAVGKKAGSKSPAPVPLYISASGASEILYEKENDDKLFFTSIVPLIEKSKPLVRSKMVDLSKDTGMFYIHNLYQTQRNRQHYRGHIKALRVFTINFRPAAIGSVPMGEGRVLNGNVYMPIGVGNTSHDIKIYRGEVVVYSDGSVMFEVPAGKGLYFQALDKEKNVLFDSDYYAVMPGEHYSCISFWDDYSKVPGNDSFITQAMEAGVIKLSDYDIDESRGISFVADIKPILQKAVKWCSDNGIEVVSTPETAELEECSGKRSWDELYLGVINCALKKDKHGKVDYVADNQGWMLNWQITSDTISKDREYWRYGAAKSRLVPYVERFYRDMNISDKELLLLKRWIDLGCPYCGSYDEANMWTKEEKEYYNKRITTGKE